jgi:hypothetical protein
MNFVNRIFARVTLVALIVPALLTGTVVPAFAHDAPCPYCGLKIVQNTKAQDNEVVLRYGNKRIEYRCVLCALAEAKTKYKNDVTILAPSNVKGKPVTVTRKSGQWSTTPDTALFVYAKGNHKECETRYRAVADKAAFDSFVHANRPLLKDAKALTLKEMIDLSK